MRVIFVSSGMWGLTYDSILFPYDPVCFHFMVPVFYYKFRVRADQYGPDTPFGSDNYSSFVVHKFRRCVVRNGNSHFGGASLICVFASLIHSTIFTCLSTLEEQAIQQVADLSSNSTGNESEADRAVSAIQKWKLEQRARMYNRFKRRFDIFGRIAFPIGYFIFNSVYWSHYYTSGTDQLTADGEIQQPWSFEFEFANKRGF